MPIPPVDQRSAAAATRRAPRAESRPSSRRPTAATIARAARFRRRRADAQAGRHVRRGASGASAKTTSPSTTECAGRTARAIPSCASIATRLRRAGLERHGRSRRRRASCCRRRPAGRSAGAFAQSACRGADGGPRLAARAPRAARPMSGSTTSPNALTDRERRHRSPRKADENGRADAAAPTTWATPRSLPTVAPVPAPTAPVSTGPSGGGAARRLAHRRVRKRLRIADREVEEDRARRRSGPAPGPTANPRPARASHAMTPFAAASPNALPPVKRSPSISRDEVARREDAGLTGPRRAAADVHGRDRARRREDDGAAGAPVDVARVADAVSGEKGRAHGSRRVRDAAQPRRAARARGRRRSNARGAEGAEAPEELAAAVAAVHDVLAFAGSGGAPPSPGAGARRAPSCRASLQKSAPCPTRGPLSRNAQACAASCRSVSTRSGLGEVRRDRDPVRRPVHDLAARQLAATRGGWTRPVRGRSARPAGRREAGGGPRRRGSSTGKSRLTWIRLDALTPVRQTEEQMMLRQRTTWSDVSSWQSLRRRSRPGRRSRPRGTMVEFASGSEKASGYLALPPGAAPTPGDRRHPGVVGPERLHQGRRRTGSRSRATSRSRSTSIAARSPRTPTRRTSSCAGSPRTARCAT